jgi:hypothetical protein
VPVGLPPAAVFFAAGGLEQRRRAWYQLFFLHQPAAEQGLAAHGWALLREMLQGEPDEAVEQYVAALSRPGERRAGGGPSAPLAGVLMVVRCVLDLPCSAHGKLTEPRGPLMALAHPRPRPV